MIIVLDFLESHEFRKQSQQYKES